MLVVHNHYSSRVPSGENLAVHDEAGWLRAAGVEVVAHEAHNDAVVAGGAAARLRQAAGSVWSVGEQRRLARAVAEHRPDLVHVHNLFPLMTASVPWAAGRRGLPVVWTVHNRRARCVAGTNFRDGQPCTECRPGWRVPGVRHACYGGSAAASTLVTASTSLFAGWARRHVTALAISEAVERWLVGPAGFDPGRVRVKYNGIAAPAVAATAARPSAGRAFVYAGHLGAHKGVPLLLDAWDRARPDLPADAALHLAGDGELADEVRAAADRDPGIAWHGSLPVDGVHALMASARAVVVPSRWEEPFGRVAAEGLACGRPVVTTGTGGLAEIVDDSCGWVTGPAVADLAAALVAAARDDAGVDRRGQVARRRHGERFSPDATTRALLAVYRDVLATS